MTAAVPAKIDLTHTAVPASISFAVLFTLALVLAGSSAVVWVLIRRWTTQRRLVALTDWASVRGFSLTRAAKNLLPVPPPVSGLKNVDSRALWALTRGPTTLAQIETDTTPASKSPDRAARWNVLARDVGASWPPTALRPAAHAASLLDAFSLSSFPSLLEPERFVVFGTDSDAAKALARSGARTLLPPDIGLLLHGKHLLLDFSTRPFDEIEFDRMLALAEQLTQHLPAWG
jgi:hypothetical protein